MNFRFSEDFLKVLELGRDEALRTGWRNIGIDHLVLGILRHGDNSAARALNALGIAPDEFKARIDGAVFSCDEIPYAELNSILPGPDALRLISLASVESVRTGGETTPLHLLLALDQAGRCFSRDFLSSLGIRREEILRAAGTVPLSEPPSSAGAGKTGRTVSASIDYSGKAVPGNCTEKATDSPVADCRKPEGDMAAEAQFPDTEELSRALGSWLISKSSAPDGAFS